MNDHKTHPPKAVLFRKSMVVFQYTISIALVIGTLVVIQQINHTKNRPLGYDSNGAITIEMTASGHYSKSEAIKNDLLASSSITHFAQSSAPLTEIWTMNDNFKWEGMTAGMRPMIATFYVTHDYGTCIGWEVIRGRDFDAALSTDSSAIVLNEAAVDYMGFDDPLGKKIEWFKDFKVVGVIKNIMTESPFTDIQPAVYIINPGDNINFTILRLNPTLSPLEAVSEVEDIYKKHLPDTPFEFDFVSDLHARKFRFINKIGMLVSVFACLAIIISCLGLFGLASFTAEQRTKEVGIRKVLGASVLQLWKLLSKEFVRLVLIACLVAMPIAYFGLKNWLEAYEYRIEIQWWFFLVALVTALLIAVLTVSEKSIRVASGNPSDSLKSE